jgi:sugar lactone lactonase YvrE
MQTFTAKPLFVPDSEELRFLPECPRVLRNYSGNGSVLGWVAIQHGPDARTGSLNLLNLETGVNRNIPLPGRPGFYAESDRPGVLVVGLDRRLVLVNLDTGSVRETGIAVPEDERVIINEGLPIDGGLIFGTKHLAFQEPVAAVYHFDSRSRRLRLLLREQICSNGKFVRRGEGECVLIDIDSHPRSISRYRFDEAMETLLEHRHVVAPESLHAFPDGLRATAGGESIVVAFYNPEQVSDGSAQEIRLCDGVVINEWVVPGSPRVTCPEFAMIGGKVRLLFTTAVEGMPEATRAIAHGAGSIYWADTPFEAMPEPPPLVAITE